MVNDFWRKCILPKLLMCLFGVAEWTCHTVSHLLSKERRFFCMNKGAHMHFYQTFAKNVSFFERMKVNHEKKY